MDSRSGNIYRYFRVSFPSSGPDKGVSHRSGMVQALGGATVVSMYGLPLCSYGKQKKVTWGNSLGAVGVEKEGKELVE